MEGGTDFQALKITVHAYLPCLSFSQTIRKCQYRSGTVNSNTVNSNFHLIRSYCEIFFYNFPNTGQEWLIQSHSSARFCFELSGNSN